MENHKLFSDLEFIHQFEKEKLNLAILDHEAQLRLIWIYFNKLGRESTIELILSKIEDYLKKNKSEYEYEQELAKQTIRVVTIYIKKSKSDTFSSFLQHYPDIKNDTKELFSDRTKFPNYG